MHKFYRTLTAAAVFAALMVAGMLFGSKSGQAANDNNGAQDEKQMIKIGTGFRFVRRDYAQHERAKIRTWWD